MTKGRTNAGGVAGLVAVVPAVVHSVAGQVARDAEGVAALEFPALEVVLDVFSRQRKKEKKGQVG